MNGQFEIGFVYQVIAVFLLAITGAMVAIEKKYDFAGVFTLAFIAGAGGAIIRDGVFLSRVPVVIENWQYLVAIILAAIITAIFMPYIKKITAIFVAIDALGLGLFGIISTQIALSLDFNVLSAMLIGLIGAIGGGFLRDIFTKNDPLLLMPGQYYITAALIGIILFIGLTVYAGMNGTIAGIIAIAIIFVIRMLSFKFNWQTAPAINISQKIFKKKDLQ